MDSMEFEKEKKMRLSRKDNSKKGSIDSKIKCLVSKINRKNEYYTTSSCSGRIMLLSEGKAKNEAEWLFVSHGKVSLAQIKGVLEKAGSNIVWFRFEPMILHVCCKSLESAERLLESAKSAGFKHSGIVSIKKRVVIEIRGTDFISAPLQCPDKRQLKILIDEANKKMKRNDSRIKNFALPDS